MRNIEQKYGIIGKSEEIRQLIQAVEQVAPSNISILILGESGVGKELVAKALHELSLRRHGPYVIVNCGAIPAGTIESELFGHKKGSYTGAVEDRKGFFETADKGTILLDEIGELPPETQVKLLRVLEQGEITRVGESTSRKVDVRVIGATNRDLGDEVRNGRFRKDLYYRLKTIMIRIPALRERREDIPMLAEYFMMRYADEHHAAYKPITPQAMELLLRAPWEGNVRELKNFIESVFILENGKIIRPETVSMHLNPHYREGHYDTRLPVRVNKDSEQVERELILRQLFLLRQDIEEIKNKLSQIDIGDVVTMNKMKDISRYIQGTEAHDIDVEAAAEDRTIQEIEKETIARTLEKYYGSKRKTAQALGMSERTLYRKIKEYDLRD
ncbi:MAG: sigma-54 dependent transcriptional regulator [Candidatus Marinimicrobia bacterium]|jgi:DNA-binding NtrC family response regulator|nr:sigma-54 dependent transcriptional regulator [Candidatus Neomarinimicrobiota bacterium]MDD4961032.1 sigma-54 dependent transcriptional regulator [Candidatus Neomarinimicrobiota bacterium]MDD5709132.1 sigma-54 dependent transcriptional regulator [Candidatus Neomarinimicrobiota bacterium]MDX9777566.1 sigma-54 dependent transcriptional regulator [bacterium]